MPWGAFVWCFRGCCGGRTSHAIQDTFAHAIAHAMGHTMAHANAHANAHAIGHVMGLFVWYLSCWLFIELLNLLTASTICWQDPARTPNLLILLNLGSVFNMEFQRKPVDGFLTGLIALGAYWHLLLRFADDIYRKLLGSYYLYKL
jgi:hypothetical protein